MPFRKNNKPTYSAVSDEENEKETLDFEEAQRSFRPTGNRLRNCAFLVVPSVLSVMTVLALLVLAKSFQHSSTTANPPAAATPYTQPGAAGLEPATATYQPSHTNPHLHSCGNTADEARARGCIFDTISFSWLVPECYDGELVDEFSRLPVHFPFYADPEGSVELPWSEVEKGERTMYVPWSHHLWHCGFLWRKMHRAIMAGKPIDSYIGSYEHTVHCTHIMVAENAQHTMEEVNTEMALKFPYCGPGKTQWTGGTNFTGHDAH